MKRGTVKWLKKVVNEGYAEAHPVNAADALATDAENRALRAENRELKRLGKENMKTYLSFECDGCESAPCIVCQFAAALAPRPKRGGR